MLLAVRGLVVLVSTVRRSATVHGVVSRAAVMLRVNKRLADLGWSSQEVCRHIADIRVDKRLADLLGVRRSADILPTPELTSGLRACLE